MSINGDILEEEEGEDGEWVMSVARGVGNVVASVSGAIRKAGRGLPLRTPAPRRKRHRVDVKRTLRSLGKVVTAHERDGFESLEGDAEFWRLIAQLSRAPRRVRLDHVDDVPRSSVGQVIDADVKQGSDSE